MPVNLNENLRDQISLITDKYNLFLRNTEKNLYQNNLMIDSDYNVISSTNGQALDSLDLNLRMEN